MDRISKSLLEEFAKENELASLPEEDQFEHFAAFLAISRHHAEHFRTHDVITGSGGDTGVDAIATVVNGKLTSDADDVKEFAERNGYIDASFIFVQAERSPHFEIAKIGNFGFGVVDFFSDKPRLSRNKSVSEAATIMGEVFRHSSKFTRGKPACRLYYVTTGSWQGDPNLEARRHSVIEDLRRLNVFGVIEFIPVDADGIQRLYRQAKSTLTREFVFAERSVVPEMAGVKEAYIGLVPASQFLSLLDDGTGTIIKNLFYDNVRDWQDYNEVNTDIKDTLSTPEGRARFALMNNGVTIIARDVRTIGNKFLIEDYQIVNGCQTSHVLFDQRALLTDDRAFVPLRLIATTDENVVASIVKATNRQTEVRPEQLIAISDFQKRLESFFGSFAPPQRLYYERRSCQFASVSGIEKNRIVTPNDVIRAYAAMFLIEPHRTTRNYNRLLPRIGADIFGPDHKSEPYYLSASALYRLESLFRTAEIDSRYKVARYQILMAARILANPITPGRPNSNEVARYAENITAIMWDAPKAAELFRKAIPLIDDVSKGSLDSDTVRTEPFTERLQAAAIAASHSLKGSVTSK